MKSRFIELAIAVLIVAALFAGLWFGFFKQTKAEQAVVPKPVLQQPIRLRIAHIVNPRFVRFNEQQIQQFLNQTKLLTQQHFGIDIEFDWVGQRQLADLVAAIPQPVWSYKQDFIVDPNDINSSMRQSLDSSLIETLAMYPASLEDLRSFAQQYLIEPPGRSFETFANSLTETLLHRQNYWRKVKSLDGLPVINRDPYHEWVVWDSLGYGRLDFDVAITNQLVASVESYGMDMHSSLRGGITLGTTSNSMTGSLGTFAWVSTFPVLNDHPEVMILRDDERYDEQQQADYAAALMTHELGHLLLHISHPWGQAGCVMAPMPLLNYSQWYEQLDSEKCPLGSHPANTPGSVDITYDVIE